MQFLTAKLNANQLERIKQLKGTVFSVRGSCMFMIHLPIKSGKFKQRNLILVKGVQCE